MGKGVRVTAVFCQCRVRMGIKPVINPCVELEALEQKKGDTIVSYFECTSCGHRVAFSYKRVE